MDNTYTIRNKMSDIISDDYHLIQVFSRFSLTLGFGEKTVKEVCDEQNIDTNTFLAVVNFIKFGEDVAADWINKVSVKPLTEYLQQSHSYFLDYIFPEIRIKLLNAMDYSSKNELSMLILKYFDEYFGEVRKHMEFENTDVFTYVSDLLSGKKTPTPSMPIEKRMSHHTAVEEKLSELKDIIIKYYNYQGNNNALYSALLNTFLCAEDLYQHYRMEECLYVPSVHLLEKKINTGQMKEAEEPFWGESDASVLSDREKEIVKCVVEGLTNKEIATKLYISFNTVTTHRRNIARKLKIHSSAGLTIYAIANNLVDINDLNL